MVTSFDIVETEITSHLLGQFKKTLFPKGEHHVKADEIAVSRETLLTGGLDTCAALIVSKKGVNALAHITAVSRAEDYCQVIREIYGTPSEGLKISVANFETGYSQHASNVIKTIVRNLGLEKSQIEKLPSIACMDEITVSAQGIISIMKVAEVRERLPKQTYIQRNGKTYEFITNASNAEENSDGVVLKLLPLGQFVPSQDVMYQKAILGPPVGDEITVGGYKGIYKEILTPVASVNPYRFKIISLQST